MRLPWLVVGGEILGAASDACKPVGSG